MQKVALFMHFANCSNWLDDLSTFPNPGYNITISNGTQASYYPNQTLWKPNESSPNIYVLNKPKISSILQRLHTKKLSSRQYTMTLLSEILTLNRGGWYSDGGGGICPFVTYIVFKYFMWPSLFSPDPRVRWVVNVSGPNDNLDCWRNQDKWLV